MTTRQQDIWARIRPFFVSKRSFWWPHMTDDCNVFVQRCPICGKCKTPSNPPRAALRKHHAGFPMERVHLDVLGPFVKSALGNKYILVMVDQFTKWVDAAAIPEQSAETVALKFIDYMVSPQLSVLLTPFLAEFVIKKCSTRMTL